MASAPSPLIGGSGGSGYTYQASQAMMQRPWYQSLLASWGNPKELSQSQKDQLVAAAKQDTALVQQFPALKGNIEATDHGMIQPKGTFVRDALIGGGLLAGGIGLAGALGAGGAAAAGAGEAGGAGASVGVPAATAGTLPSTTIGTGMIGPIAGGASGAVPAAFETGAAVAGGAGAAGAAAAGGSSLWSKLAAPLISAGTSVAQGAISANAAKSAAEQQKEATMAALDLQKQIWQQQQSNLAPYMSLGPGAISNLQGLTGTRPASQVFGGK